MSHIDTYHIATGGQNFEDTYTLASNGILIRVEVQPIPSIPIRQGGGSAKPWEVPYQKENQKEITRKRIVVTAIIDGEEYREEVIVEDKPNLKAKDIEVQVIQKDKKPKIKITF